MSRLIFQLRLKVAYAQDAVLILAIDVLHELEERVLPEPLLDHADHLAAAVISGRGEVDEVLVLFDRLHRRMDVATLASAEIAVVAQVLAVDIGQPPEPG